jgi:hypothetical protein
MNKGDDMHRLIRNVICWLLALGLAGCGQILVGIEEQSTPAQPGGEPTAKVEPTIPEVTAAPTEAASPYWDLVEDERTGLRFAIPCFWQADIPTPQQDPTGRGAFSVRNFDDQYAMSFPRSQIPEDAGAVKIDFLYWESTDFGVLAGASLSDFKIREFFAGSDSEILSSEIIEVNGQDAIHLLTEGTFGSGELYIMQMSDGLVLGFAPVFSPDNPDVQGVLQSIALTPETGVRIPTFQPAPPPVGLAASCIPGYATAVEPTQALTEENTACGRHSFRSLEYLTTKVERYLQDRNTGGLIYEYLVNDPFVVGYWGSEGVTLSPQDAFSTFANSLYRADQPGGMTFTTDRGRFPSLAGMPPEAMFGPDVDIAQIVYSEGWGLEGQGAALLYFARDECGGYYWYGLVFSQRHFEQ